MIIFFYLYPHGLSPPFNAFLSEEGHLYIRYIRNKEKDKRKNLVMHFPSSAFLSHLIRRKNLSFISTGKAKSIQKKKCLRYKKSLLYHPKQRIRPIKDSPLMNFFDEKHLLSNKKIVTL